MDPEEVLSELREMAEWEKVGGYWNVEDANQRCIKYGNLFDALDTWLSNGGFFPASWAQPQPIPEPSTEKSA